jgi:hypothetical protein
MHKRCVVFHKVKEIIISQKFFIEDLVIIRITKSGLNYLNYTNSLIKNKEGFELSQI